MPVMETRAESAVAAPRPSRVGALLGLLNPGLLGANVASLALAVGSLKLLSVLLSVEDLAVYVLITAFQSFSTLILTGPLRVGLTRLYTGPLLGGQRRDYERFALGAILISGLLSMAAASAVIGAFDFGPSVHVLGVVLAVAYGVLMDYASFLSGAALQRARVAVAAWFMLAPKLALIGGILVAVAVRPANLPVAILGWTLGFTVLLLAPGYRVRRAAAEAAAPEGPPAWRTWVSELVGFSWIFVAVGVVSWAQTALPRYYLSWWQDAASVAGFYIVMQIAVAAMMSVMGAVGQTIAPRLYRRQEALPGHVPSPWQGELVGGAGIALAIALLGAACSLVLGDRLLLLLAREEYLGLSTLLALMFVTQGLRCAAQVLRIYGDQIKRPNIYLAANLVYPAATVLLALVGSRTGLAALCVALLAGELIHIGMIAAANQRHFVRSRT